MLPRPRILCDRLQPFGSHLPIAHSAPSVRHYIVNAIDRNELDAICWVHVEVVASLLCEQRFVLGFAKHVI